MAAALAQAVAALQQGGVIAYPTEAVYGLGCDPQQLPAVQRLLALKQREPHKGLILIASDFSQLEPYLAELPEAARHRALASWPGPFTWLWPARPQISEYLRGAHATLAVRITAHPLARALCQAFGGALVSSSANRSNQEPARSAQQVREYFADRLDYILEGQLGPQASPTEIRDALTGELVRGA